MSKYHDLKADLAVAQAHVERHHADLDRWRANYYGLAYTRTCLLAGPNRGDCEHFVGWNQNADEWGVPAGWCVVCYWKHKADETALALSDLSEWSRREIIELNAQIQQAQGLNQHLAERNARLQHALELAQTHLPLEDPVQGEP